MDFPKPVSDLIIEFSKLPGIGRKSAQRLVEYLLKVPKEQVEKFGDSLKELKTKVHFCSKCFHITETENLLCNFCRDSTRDPRIVCVVEDFIDVFAIENSKSFHGLYHVLHGRLSPIDGVGPDALTINELVKRTKDEDITEIIIATNPTMEGEATAMYIKRQIGNPDIKITRIAKGMPVGGDIDYADEVTLGNSMKQRTEY